MGVVSDGVWGFLTLENAVITETYFQVVRNWPKLSEKFITSVRCGNRVSKKSISIMDKIPSDLAFWIGIEKLGYHGSCDPWKVKLCFTTIEWRVHDIDAVQREWSCDSGYSREVFVKDICRKHQKWWWIRWRYDAHLRYGMPHGRMVMLLLNVSCYEFALSVS